MEVTVCDSFEIKGRVALEYGAQGIVAVFSVEAADELPIPGEPLLIVRPDGWMRRATIGEVKQHGPDGRSCFIKGLSRQDVPIGSRLRWGNRLWPDPEPAEHMIAKT
jgi:hypothetical protein